MQSLQAFARAQSLWLILANRTINYHTNTRMSSKPSSSREAKTTQNNNSAEHVLAESHHGGGGLPPTSVSQLALYICRHAERVDFTFGHRWWVNCVDDEGNYKRVNLNLPPKLPIRDAGIASFENDTCLTSMGLYQAFLTGTGFQQHNIKITQCYSSCALRSVQTAHQILDGANCLSTTKICVEPGLFEWLGWVKDNQPRWMTPQEFAKNGLNVDPSYVPLMKAQQFNWNETVPQYYERNTSMTRHVIDKHTSTGGIILLVGHASTLDTCTRMVLNFPARTYADMAHVTFQIPYSAVVKLHPADTTESAADIGKIAKSKRDVSKTKHAVEWKIAEPEFGCSIYHDANRPFVASTVLRQSLTDNDKNNKSEPLSDIL